MSKGRRKGNAATLYCPRAGPAQAAPARHPAAFSRRHGASNCALVHFGPVGVVPAAPGTARENLSVWARKWGRLWPPPTLTLPSESVYHTGHKANLGLIQMRSDGQAQHL